MRTYLCVALATLILNATPGFPQDVPADYSAVLVALGRQGDYKAGVLRVNLPRNDLKVTIKGNPAPTPFGFGGWIALAKGTGGDVLMGDLVLQEAEVNPVMTALLDHGLEVTALHNHFFYEEPRIFFMHVHGAGRADALARQIKPALDLIPRPPAPGSPAPSTPPLDTARIAQVVGAQGEQSGPVYKITIGRDDLKLSDMGAPINARMGLNTWAAFTGGNDHAMVAGDVAMLESEVQPVLKALRKNGLEVVSIHHHMLHTQPAIIFLHYWGSGPAESLARAFRAALDQLGRG